MEKRLFQILDEMNVGDDENKTANCGVCNAFLSAQSSKAGARITMGAPIEAINNIGNGETIPILLLINSKEYERIKNLKSTV